MSNYSKTLQTKRAALLKLQIKRKISKWSWERSVRTVLSMLMPLVYLQDHDVVHSSHNPSFRNMTFQNTQQHFRNTAAVFPVIRLCVHRAMWCFQLPVWHQVKLRKCTEILFCSWPLTTCPNRFCLVECCIFSNTVMFSEMLCFDLLGHHTFLVPVIVMIIYHSLTSKNSEWHKTVTQYNHETLKHFIIKLHNETTYT